MQMQLSAMNKSPSKSVGLQLPPLLTWLNHYMFMSMGLEVPNSLLYEWQEHHFRVPRTDSLPSPQSVSLTPDLEGKLGEEERLVSAVKALLPEFRLLPPLPSTGEAHDALRRNIE